MNTVPNSQTSKLQGFLHYVSTKKRNLGDWSFLHVRISDEVQGQGYFDEILQYLDFQFQDEDSRILKNEENKEVILVTPSRNTEALLQFDKNVYENFPSDVIRAYTNSFKDGRLAQFSEIVTDMVPPDNIISNITLKRMKRSANTIMVLDDDIMILKQAEKVLEGFGNVITVKSHTAFLDSYKEHAPNILFMDVHLGQVRGPQILNTFFEKIDPYAHVVIISSDSTKETVQDAVQKNVKGYVVKPFNQQQLLEHVMKADTFCARV